MSSYDGTVPRTAEPPAGKYQPDSPEPPRATGSIPASTFVYSARRNVNRDFRDVTAAGGAYCYDAMRAGRTTGGLPTGALNGILLVALEGGTRLKVERQDAETCAAAAPWNFTESVTTFER